MRLILASSNRSKIKELKALCTDFNVIAYSEIIDEFEIIEDGKTFKENALIKARAVYEMLDEKDLQNSMVIADDSGMCVEVLNFKPGIHSARYSGGDAKKNMFKVSQEIKESGICSSKAHYITAIAIVSSKQEYCVHGWMYGEALSEQRGSNGFGYDPIFVPDGFNETLGELDDDTKSKISHRAKALKLALKIIQTL